METFRLLVRREPDGVPAGELARLMAVPQNTMSAHLAILARAGLVNGQRQSRSIIYRADLLRFREVALFLLKDCCGGRPDVCAPLVADLTTCCPANVLFLCTGNSARSIMAESILRRLGAGRFNAFSAGSHPKGAINPFALKTIVAYGCPTEGLRSKSWDEFATPDAPNLDFAFTLCDDTAGETCPAWPGQPMTAHWGIEDPAMVPGTDIEKERAFAQAFRYLRNRTTVFIALPIKSLDNLSLTARLREIGKMEGATRVPLKMKDAHHE
jgi:protein-tyrosine-phosphatase/DNA-binding transcriptional ArsR family regulator